MEITRHWRLKAQRYRLEGSLCPGCGRLTFPPRPLCPICAAQPANSGWTYPLPVGLVNASGLEPRAECGSAERMTG
jgi:hypothetical protein